MSKKAEKGREEQSSLSGCITKTYISRDFNTVSFTLLKERLTLPSTLLALPFKVA